MKLFLYLLSEFCFCFYLATVGFLFPYLPMIICLALLLLLIMWKMGWRRVRVFHWLYMRKFGAWDRRFAVGIVLCGMVLLGVEWSMVGLTAQDWLAMSFLLVSVVSYALSYYVP